MSPAGGARVPYRPTNPCLSQAPEPRAWLCHTPYIVYNNERPSEKCFSDGLSFCLLRVSGRFFRTRRRSRREG
ncbi:hypothetical protein HMPREF9123_1345 [Neisseria bacilliformis ATCC BAA-1200]|uniref:Uncharacterized protein n=1 Tax=Neisseria bacilliformis ATCC BAA-1200 TaxID=888742 RepID=F2BCB7_9NEIS|nr:hypothetical protein HMPREF9123_1345 [Neisseria bacilliformis ATCC BAA-1200]